MRDVGARPPHQVRTLHFNCYVKLAQPQDWPGPYPDVMHGHGVVMMFAMALLISVAFAMLITIAFNTIRRNRRR